MSNAELAFLLFLILTVGHYAVIWSIYLEKQLVRQPIRAEQVLSQSKQDYVMWTDDEYFQDELLSKKKKEKKKKLTSRPAEELRCADQDRADR